ncbi:hypothetical protein [Pseudonocardia hydrocarbonoxydans]|uniref:hypothetical protein n=1 Tax=Pseudonocardia hydrocarbonoxydans TaxID=76726 RepID=UPI00114334F2|nr:hypothetical protein [Pseudonocardia hydrocarbonoxydans]
MVRGVGAIVLACGIAVGGGSVAYAGVADPDFGAMSAPSHSKTGTAKSDPGKSNPAAGSQRPPTVTNRPR